MSTGGRGVICKKTTVDEARPFDILVLQRKGLFKEEPGVISISRWYRGDIERGSICSKLEVEGKIPSAIRLIYAITNKETTEVKRYNYLVDLDSTPCYFGGVRWWFICPLIVNGAACRRRSRILYLPPGATYFGCRECHQLSYDSRQMSRNRFYEEFIRQNKMIKMNLK
jgi:hypothetical protein